MHKKITTILAFVSMLFISQLSLANLNKAVMVASPDGTSNNTPLLTVHHSGLTQYNFVSGYTGAVRSIYFPAELARGFQAFYVSQDGKNTYLASYGNSGNRYITLSISQDGGQSWHSTISNYPSDNILPMRLYVSPNEKTAYLFMSGDPCELLKSVDGGKTWIKIKSFNMSDPTTTEVFMSQGTNIAAYVAYGNIGVGFIQKNKWYTQNDFLKHGLKGGAPVFDIYATTSGQIFVATCAGLFYNTVAFSKPWKDITPPPLRTQIQKTGNYLSTAHIYATKDHLYLMTTAAISYGGKNDFFVSTNNGVTWKDENRGLNNFLYPSYNPASTYRSGFYVDKYGKVYTVDGSGMNPQLGRPALYIKNPKETFWRSIG